MPDWSHSQLAHVANFRAVSQKLPRLYRSAHLDAVDEKDIALLLDKFQIRTLVDLRSLDEINAATLSKPAQLMRTAFKTNRKCGPGELASEGSHRLKIVHAPLLGNVDAFFDQVERMMPPTKRAQALALRSFSGKRYDQFLCDQISAGKQQILYTAMLRSAADELAKGLRAAADRSKGAVLIHCAKGKDRTGVLSALLQHAAGEDEQTISDDYSVSESLLQNWSDSRACLSVSSSTSGGVDWSQLRGSPPSAILETFAWIRAEYGAIDYFLEGVLGSDYGAWRADIEMNF